MFSNNVYMWSVLLVRQLLLLYNSSLKFFFHLIRTEKKKKRLQEINKIEETKPREN